MSTHSATNENTDGALQSFFVKQDGSLTAAIGQTSSGGNGPAFAVPLSTGEVAVMNVSRLAPELALAVAAARASVNAISTAPRSIHLSLCSLAQATA